MQRSSTIDILLVQNLSVAIYYRASVAFKQGIGSHIEITVAPDRVSIMVDSAHEMTMFDVCIFETETFLNDVKFIENDFLQADALVVQQSH